MSSRGSAPSALEAPYEIRTTVVLMRGAPDWMKRRHSCPRHPHLRSVV